MKSIVLASGNPGKLREFAQILADFHLDVVPQSQFNVPYVPETGESFVENALIKDIFTLCLSNVWIYAVSHNNHYIH